MIDETKELVNSYQEKNKSGNGFWQVYLATFSTVFLAELGDKTQIATLLLTAQSGRPLLVFIGSAIALICSSLVCVLIGVWLSKLISPKRFEYMAGILMVGIGALLGIQATHSLIQNLKIL